MHLEPRSSAPICGARAILQAGEAFPQGLYHLVLRFPQTPQLLPNSHLEPSPITCMQNPIAVRVGFHVRVGGRRSLSHKLSSKFRGIRKTLRSPLHVYKREQNCGCLRLLLDAAGRPIDSMADTATSHCACTVQHTSVKNPDITRVRFANAAAQASYEERWTQNTERGSSRAGALA
jgi:hypothetical protein